MSKYNAKELADIKVALTTLFIGKGFTQEQAEAKADVVMQTLLIV
jgi:hypothetical protein